MNLDISGRIKPGWTIRVLLAVLTFLLLLTFPAVAVCPKPDPKVCAEFLKDDAVFVGIVVSERTVPPKGYFYDGWLYRLRVQRVFRGPVGEFIDVFTENSSARFRLEVGREYLLFAAWQDDRFVVGNCGHSGLLSEATTTIREIEQVGETSDGVIEGHVAGGTLSEGVPGIRVLIRGEDQTFSVVTDEDGWFRMTVRPGRYSVQVQSPQVRPYDLSYDNPNDFVVSRGGCAQLQFRAWE